MQNDAAIFTNSAPRRSKNHFEAGDIDDQDDSIDVELEEMVNDELGRGQREIHIAYIPVSRDDLIPALLEGRGDLAAAKELMKKLYRAMNILESGKFVQKIKFGAELQGLKVGECRAPLGPLTDAEKAEFEEAMAPILAL